MTPTTILAAILSLPAALPRGDVAAVAEAIAGAAKSRTEVAALIAIGHHESKFAALVLEGRCAEMPVGQQCDHGKARGVWQLHAEACPRAWELPEGSRESLAEEARCVVALPRWGARQGTKHALTPLHAAFSAYAGHGPTWPGAEPRVRTVRMLLERKW